MQEWPYFTLPLSSLSIKHKGSEILHVSRGNIRCDIPAWGSISAITKSYCHYLMVKTSCFHHREVFSRRFCYAVTNPASRAGAQPREMAACLGNTKSALTGTCKSATECREITATAGGICSINSSRKKGEKPWPNLFPGTSTQGDALKGQALCWLRMNILLWWIKKMVNKELL